jgi:RNA polymerase sigma-70 factor (ECF subfamily)
VTGGDVNRVEASNPTSSSLLRRVQANDQVAWQRLVSLYSPLVYRWCRQAGLQAADAADVGQEVFRAVARKVQDFRRDRADDTFQGWLRVITRNKLHDFARRLRPESQAVGGQDLQQLPGAASSTPDFAENLAEDTRLLFQRALELMQTEFEPRSWQSFWRVTVEDQPPEDVARDLGTTVNAVYLAKSRVLRRLREEFADLLEV